MRFPKTMGLLLRDCHLTSKQYSCCWHVKSYREKIFMKDLSWQMVCLFRSLPCNSEHEYCKAEAFICTPWLLLHHWMLCDFLCALLIKPYHRKSKSICCLCNFCTYLSLGNKNQKELLAFPPPINFQVLMSKFLRFLSLCKVIRIKRITRHLWSQLLLLLF